MENKFGTAEIILGGMFTLSMDIISALLDLTGVGWILATVIQFFTSGATTLWVWSKGSKKATKLSRQLKKQLTNILPWVPTCFLAFLVEVALHNYPEKFGKFSNTTSGSSKSKIAGAIGKKSENKENIYKKAA